MNQDWLLIIMTVFVATSAIALLIQMVMLMRIASIAKALQAQITQFTPQVQSVLQTAKPAIESAKSALDTAKGAIDTAKATLEQSRKHLAEITGRATSILDATRLQLVKIDDVVTDATTRAKLQLDRIDLVLEDTVSRAHETVAVFHNGVMRPLRQINGVSAGIRAAVRTLVQGERSNVSEATHDEEMFI
jgi:hypothetical protein